MTNAIDIDVLRKMLSRAEMMIPYYQGDVDKHRTENAAMAAAGLEPLHGEWIVKHTAEDLARVTSEAEVLRAVITYHTGGIFTPKTEEAA